MGLILKASKSSAQLSSVRQTDRGRKKERGGGGGKGPIVREGRKEGDCLLQPSSSSSDFPIVFRVVTFVSMVVGLSDGVSTSEWKEWRVRRRNVPLMRIVLVDTRERDNALSMSQRYQSSKRYIFWSCCVVEMVSNSQ